MRLTEHLAEDIADIKGAIFKLTACVIFLTLAIVAIILVVLFQ